MCFRNALSAKYQKLAQKYGKLLNVVEMYQEVYGEKYHINAFTNPLCPVITPDPQIQLYYWGLLPNWLRVTGDYQSYQKAIQAMRSKTYNARSETIFEKSTFRTPVLKSRCLIPSTGYFEHHHETNGTKTPYFIHLKNTGLFSMAGIYDRWKSPAGDEIYSFSLITTPANELTGWIHNGGSNGGRMPLILSEEDEMKWLQPDLSYNEITALMQTYPAENMQGYAIKSDFLKKNPFDPTILEPENMKTTSLFPG